MRRTWCESFIRLNPVMIASGRGTVKTAVEEAAARQADGCHLGYRHVYVSDVRFVTVKKAKQESCGNNNWNVLNGTWWY